MVADVTCKENVPPLHCVPSLTLLRHHGGDVQLEAPEHHAGPEQLAVLDLASPNTTQSLTRGRESDNQKKTNMCNQQPVINVYLKSPTLKSLQTGVIENCPNVQLKMTNDVALS